MRALVRLSPAALLVAIASVAPEAHAEVPAYGAVSSGHFTLAPKSKAPALIAAREQVPGLFVVSQKFSPETPASARHVTVVGDAKIANAIRAGEGFGRDDADVGACFTEASGRAFVSNDEDDDDAERAREWNTSQMWQVNVWPRSKDNDTAGVAAVHSERLVEASSGATLEITDAWIDPTTRGARLIAKASVPLTLIGSAVGGVTVYAARDDRAQGKRLVQFIVARSQASTSAGTSGRVGSMMAMRQDGESAHGNGCGHLRVALSVEAGNGDSAIAIVPVQLPDASAASAKQPATAKDDDAKPEAAPAATSSARPPRGVGPKAFLRRLKKRAPSVLPPPTHDAKEPKEREVRTREMQVHFSVSQTSADKAPVLAASFGWSGREQVVRTFDEPPSDEE